MTRQSDFHLRLSWLFFAFVTAGLMWLLPTRGAGAAPPPAPPSFSSSAELITVEAVVLDSHRQPVPGLTRDDFVLFENGRPQEIVRFEAFDRAPRPEPAPGAAVLADNDPAAQPPGRTFAVLVDDLRIDTAQADRARRTVAAFIAKTARDGDAVTLGTTTGEIWWSARIPEGRADLLAVLGRVKGRALDAVTPDRMTDYEAYWIDNAFNAHEPGTPMGRVMRRYEAAGLCDVGASASNVPGKGVCETLVRGRAREFEGLRQARTRQTLVAVRRALDALAPARGRKSLLLVSPGFVADAASAARDVAAASREANTAVYFVDVRGLVASLGYTTAADVEPPTEPHDALTMRQEESVLESAGAQTLADETGGFSVSNTNDLAGSMARIADESRVFYLLGFPPPAGKSAREWRKLRVEVKRAGLQVRARRGYSLRTTADALHTALASALDSPHSAPGIPLRAKAYVLEPRPGETTRVVLAIEVNAGHLAASAGAPPLEWTAIVTHRDSGRMFARGGTLDPSARREETPAWASLTEAYELPAGAAQARVVIRDPESGAIGSVSHRFDVPASGALRLSTPIMDRILPGATATDRPRPMPNAHRVFRTGGALFCQFEVIGAARPEDGAAPRVRAGLNLSKRDGPPVQSAPLTPVRPDASGRVMRLVGVPLDPLSDGDYELRLEVEDEVAGTRLEQTEPFTLAPATGTAGTR